MGFLTELLQTIGDRSRSLIYRPPSRPDGRAIRPDISQADLETLCELLISVRGEASGVALAQHIVSRWEALSSDERRIFLRTLAERFGADQSRLDAAIAAYQAERTPASILDLHIAAEPRRQELIRRLNLAPKGIATLVQMREELLAFQRDDPGLRVVDADFQHLFGSWFNRGFLVLKRIDWSTPANILEKIIRYEAVHEITSWAELRRRLEPADRRCFAFFHPQLIDEPLIFVEVALATAIPSRIDAVLSVDRKPIAAEEASTAAFYSISNCQEGLRGISFGNFLIKQVVEDLKRELPRLDTFVTLSPVPGLARWLKAEMAEERSSALGEEDKAILKLLDEPGWHLDAEKTATVEKALMSAAAWYLLNAKNAAERPIDPVSRFHLGNGARLEQINFCGDTGPNGRRQSHGIMVNYLYKLDDIEQNHEAFVSKGEVAASAAVTKLLRPDTAPAVQKSGRSAGAAPQKPRMEKTGASA
ncbi:MAG: malonyl-CoA decarboxylase [Beijerinckiaceae bacterium]|nr:malonyl-CoA decarboxylase [Beijerinckiaceae bacterium]